MANGNGSTIVIKSWTVVLTVITWLVLCAMAFATMREDSAENTRRIQRLEERPTVTIDQYKDGQAAIEKRLDYIQNKLDEKKACGH